MKATRLLPLLGLCAALTFSSAATRADLIISNLSNDASAGGTVVIGLAGLSNKAFGFTMPAAGAFSLDSVTLGFNRGGALDSSFNFDLTADLFADVGGNPGGSPLLSFNPLAINGPQAAGQFDGVFTPSMSFILQPGTTYWFAVQSINSGSDSPFVAWDRRGANTLPTGLASAVGYRLDLPANYPPTAAVSDTYNDILIQGTPVPAPAPLALIMAGLVGIARLRRRRLAA